jgi:hypothetical protein
MTGTGNVVMSTSPTLVTPALGTPSALVGTNITGTATNFTASNVTTNANLTGGVTSVGNAATVVTNANLTGPITSVGNATSIASQTGTGTTFAMSASPTFTGTVGAADLTTTGNTILGDAATDTLNVGAGGLVKDASGNVGIGTASPVGKLDIISGTARMFFSNQSATAFFTAVNTANSAYAPMAINGSELILKTGDAERMRIDSSGNVGIGTSSPTVKLDVSGVAKATALSISGTTAFSAGTISQDANWGMYFMAVAGAGQAEFAWVNSASTERMRIDTSGNLLVGTTSALISSLRRGLSVLAPTGTFVAAAFANDGGSSAQTIDVWNKATTGNNAFISFLTEATSAERGSITYNRAGGLVAYNVTSDYRAKDIYGPVTDSGALIDSTPVYMGKMKDATQERPMFIAHEVPAYAHTGEKDAVDKDGNPVYQQMDASALIPVMWAEIQSLRKRLAALEA